MLPYLALTFSAMRIERSAEHQPPVAVTCRTTPRLYLPIRLCTVLDIYARWRNAVATMALLRSRIAIATRRGSGSCVNNANAPLIL